MAHQLALQKAIKKVRATRVITFHTTVRLAQRFASSDVEGIARYLKDFSVYHVNGEQPSAEREDRLNAFREAKWGVITNARCLTEGVDVPAVDMIAFMNPRRSRVDIAQATGRAMRKAGPEKTYGYVVVPLFLNQHHGESLEDALERSDFKDVANVLNAMQEQDTDLVDIIREMREARGHLGRFRISRLSEKLQIIGPRISLDRLRSNIFVRVVDRLGLSWDEYYGKLVAYRKQHRNCNVPRSWEQDRPLARWVSKQRQRKTQLSPERMQRLEALGFDWDPHKTSWAQMYGRLAVYKKQHRDCYVPRNWPQDQSLAMWVGTQRQGKDQLSPERVQQLEALGFDWDPFSTYWELMYKRLAAYKKRHGHCNASKYSRDKSLGLWVYEQRTAKAKGRLSLERMRRLKALGFDWDPFSTYWELMYKRLAAYKKRHGDCNVPDSDRWKQNQSLANWVGTQRHLKYRLPAERTQRLDALGFTWNPKNAYWEQMYERLAAYKKQHGDCYVPGNWKQDRPLAIWVSNQRHRKHQLPPERVQRLEALGFDWDPFSTYWELMYKRLAAYKKRHRHCNVPQKGKQDRRLASWVNSQRTHKTRLSSERIQQLDALGFTWIPRDTQWEEWYKRLAAYKKQHGDCNIPSSWKQDRPLARWVTKQRARKAQLSLERIRLLNALRFEWDLSRAGPRR